MQSALMDFTVDCLTFFVIYLILMGRVYLPGLIFLQNSCKNVAKNFSKNMHRFF